jgi:4-hydroxy-tetrahydrodipicolinate synthase
MIVFSPGHQAGRSITVPTSRRTFLGAAGVAAAYAAPGRPAKAPGSSQQKLYVAALTPCDKSLKFDDGLYKEMLPWFKTQGADGIVVLGTTGEYPSFSIAERKRIAETALKHRGSLAAIVQAGTTNFPDTIDLIAHAAANGADGVLVIPPFYYKKPATEGLTKYYSLIFESTRIPVYLYHISGTSAVPISNELLHSLEHYPNLAGIKDSNGDVPEYESYLKEFPKLNMMTGTGNNLKAALKAGMGAILADANLFVKYSAAVFAAARQGNDLDEPNNKLRDLNAAMRPAGVNAYGPMKYALSLLMGTRESYPRPPHLDATAEQKAQIKIKLKELGLIA